MEAVFQAFQRSAKKAGANEFTCIEVRTGDALAISDLVDTLRAQLEAAEAEVAENEAAFKIWRRRAEAAEANAARYEWLRKNCQDCADAYSTFGQLYFGTYAAGGLDAAIDAAMSRTKEETK